MIAVATNCVTGAAEYLPVRDAWHDVNAVKASSALPVLSKIVTIGGVPYLDGSMAEAIPIQYGIRQGFDKLVFILTRDAAYQKRKIHFRPCVFKKIQKVSQFGCGHGRPSQTL